MPEGDKSKTVGDESLGADARSGGYSEGNIGDATARENYFKKESLKLKKIR